MIQLHLWAPTSVDISEWEQKIDECVNDVIPNFGLLEIGPLITHIRQRLFDIQSFGPVLDEALFIPVVRQIHIVILTNYDVIAQDQFRLVDYLSHLDSFARSTRRINIVVFDLCSPHEFPKLSISELKNGIKDLSTVLNSRTSLLDFIQSEHDAPLLTCTACDFNIKSALSSVLFHISSEETASDNPN